MEIDYEKGYSWKHRQNYIFYYLEKKDIKIRKVSAAHFQSNINTSY